MTPFSTRDVTSEDELLRRVMALARGAGVDVWHVHDSRGSRPGWPDLELIGDHVAYRELKYGQGQLTLEQVRTLKRLRAAGADVGVWDEHDYYSGRIWQQLCAMSASGQAAA